MPKIERALISVSDKSDLVPFAEALSRAGVEIISTGGTAKVLREAGIAVQELSDYTRSEEHTSELQSQAYLVCRLLLEKKNKTTPHKLRLTLLPRHNPT